MDLAWNRKAEFTKWVVSAGLLTDADGQQAFYYNPANPTQARCIALTVIPCHPPVRVFTHPAYKKMLPGQWIA
jgi:hypothetical protein